MRLSQCTKCKDLVESRTQVVLPFIKGVSPTVLFLGEAPGSQEDKKGTPFVGSAGKWHWWFAEKLGVSGSCVVGNCINCRPVVIKNNRRVNGKPTDEHLRNCLQWRDNLLTMFPFKLIILYGTYPIKVVLGLKPPLTQIVGKEYNVDYLKPKVFACYHPATLIYNKKEYIDIWEQHIKTIRKLL